MPYRCLTKRGGKGEDILVVWHGDDDCESMVWYGIKSSDIISVVNATQKKRYMCAIYVIYIDEM